MLDCLLISLLACGGSESILSAAGLKSVNNVSVQPPVHIIRLNGADAMTFAVIGD